MDNSNNNNINEDSIAIIGMSGRFPGAKNVDEFWQNLKNGVESITFFSDQELIESGIDPAVLKDSNYVKAKGIIEDADKFDAAFFDISPKEAAITDPQQRLFLECAWEALENAGYNSKTYAGSIGVYGGVGANTYYLENLYGNEELRKTGSFFQIGIKNFMDFVCTQVSYRLNLSGPSVTVQTACSTSLVAVVMGCQSLLDYQCDMVLAGGSTISVPKKTGYFYQEGMIHSPDGHCRSFDVKAQGSIFSNGTGIVVLKRLGDAFADGDTIHAIIIGAAINNDGASKVGFTAPSVDGQSRAIVEALTLADVSPETISYIETHGTATPLGDPIEIAALTQAFRTKTDKKRYCAIGCAKTNVGHTDSASGVIGLIKAVLSLKHQLIPPLLHFETPNPKLNLENSPFYINTKLSEWKTNGTPRCAGVNSFGIGGTNAHVILEEAPYIKSKKSIRPWQLLLLSARTDTALETATAQLIEYFQQNPDLNLADVAYTYQIGRSTFRQRRMLMCQTLEDAVKALETRDAKRVFTQTIKDDKAPSVIFMFSGQGTQYVKMGWELYQTEKVFRKHINRCAELIKPHLGIDLRTVLYPEQTSSLQKDAVPTKGDINQTAITQPALFVIEYALAQLWKSWGVQPKAMIGHSIGEYVAACLAGVFTLEEALTLVAARGRLIQSVPAGAMLAVPLAEEEIRPLLSQNIDLAAINVSSQSVVSGTFEAIEQLTVQLAEQGIETQRLHTSHAFHSEMMAPILPNFLEQVQKVQLKAPQIPFISNVTGTWISNTQATSPNYWVKHLRQTVRFAAGLQEIFKGSSLILLEVGPGRTLSTFAKRHPDNSGQLVPTSLRHPKEEQSDSAFILNTLGQLWMAGITVNWSGFYANELRYRLPLPTYPFERQRYWIEATKPVLDKSPHQQTVITASSQLWKSLIEAAHNQAQQGIAEFDNPAYVEKFQWLNRLSAAYVNIAFRELGAFSDPIQQYSSEELLHQFHILPFYRQMVPRCLIALVEQGHLQQQGENFSHLIPFSGDNLNALVKEVRTRWIKSPELPALVQLCGERFAAILTGNENPRELLFTGSAYDTLQNFYRNSPESCYFGNIAQASIKQMVKSLPSDTHYRILEIGAGTGAITAYLLPELPLQRTHYVFTDVGPSFLSQAQQKFGEYPYLEYRLLDIEKKPTEQGYKSHSFDIVIAAQVLHATKNLGQTLEHVRSLLAPEGVLMLGEPAVSNRLYFDVYLPIMQPFEESDELRSHYPFLTTEQWYKALRKYGFVEAESFPQTDALDDRIFIAKTSVTASAFTEKVQPETILKKRPDIADWFYVPLWKHAILSISSESPTSFQQCWLVFVDEYGLGAKIVQQLEQEGKSVISVKAGSAFSSHNHAYILNPQRSEDYNTLLKALHSLDKVPTTIIHLWSVTAQDKVESDIEQLEKYQNLGFYSLLFLAQALGKHNMTDAIQMDIVSNNMQKVTGDEKGLCPEKATLIGTCKVIPQEYSNINCRSIDVVLSESEMPIEETLVDQLLAEFAAKQSDDAIIAYRNNERWVQTYKQIRLDDASEESSSRLRQNGVYLITGGLGGIGLVLAEHLAKTVHAKLILSTHSVFPKKRAWKDWLNMHGKQDSVSGKIRKVQAIEAMGAEVLIVSADVINLEQMSAAITQSLDKFGQIHGVIHAAGVYPGGMIQLKTPAMAESILAPKVKGTLVLETVLKDQKLDFMILCSSLASIAGETGMVDHCGANAFLDAFAHRNTSQYNKFTISINWDAWQEVGQATQQKITGNISLQYQYKKVVHPLFDKSIVECPEKEIYISHLSVQKHWVLGEHKVMGKPTLPGTAYLEMARAAFESYTQNGGVIEIKDVYFLAPLTVEEDEEKEVHTILTKRENGVEFVISSQSNSETWQEHARGQIAVNANYAEMSENDELKALEKKCQEKEIVFPQDALTTSAGFIEFGPRWNNLKQIKCGENQGLALLELPESFSADIKEYKLHPALLDVATSFVNLQEESSYLPFSYQKLLITGHLPTKFYSHITFKENNLSSDTLTFDIKIMDEQGRRLLKIENYTLRRVDMDFEKGEKHAIMSERENFYDAIPHETLATSGNMFQENIEELKKGLLSAEGIEVFNRILHSKKPQVLVSTWDLQARLKLIKDTISGFASSKESAHIPKSVYSRPQLSSAYIAPRNELEQTMTNTWEKFLGIERVGIFDDFFELGGDSLMAVQLVSELRRASKVELSAPSLLEKSTVAALAESIQPMSANDTQVSLQALPQSLVKIQAGNSLRQPLFLVHPIGGDIHIYHDLAHSLGIEQAVYAFRAQGVDGETQPLTQIEEMATHYINALRVIQPEGPYFLGGHSFGGLVAFEMAQQFHALDQRIALLSMMDTHWPSPLPVGNADSVDATVVAYTLGLDIYLDLPEHFGQKELEEQIRYFFDNSEAAKQANPDEFIYNIRHLLYVIKANHQAANNYVPKTYSGRILFFQARELEAFMSMKPELTWRDLATEGVDVHEVPGNHTSMNSSPNVEVMANFLKTYLQ
jgi:acyl transferase domain-containing protein/thioesterase domain-containing protein/ubiquinone/menaquinone biosynthesis C-methylase UbiE